MQNTLPEYECLRCGHKWNPRSNDKPRICPKCKSPYWDVARKANLAPEKLKVIKALNMVEK